MSIIKRTSEKYVTGTGQVLIVHSKKDCEGRFCCIHNPSPHEMINFPTHWRSDKGMMERICPCGVGHPDPDDLAYNIKNGIHESNFIHGCCGCCKGSYE